MRYREGLPLVLDKVSFSVKKGEKVGVCGRTGAGSFLFSVMLCCQAIEVQALCLDTNRQIQFIAGSLSFGGTNRRLNCCGWA